MFTVVTSLYKLDGFAGSTCDESLVMHTGVQRGDRPRDRTLLRCLVLWIAASNAVVVPYPKQLVVFILL